MKTMKASNVLPAERQLADAPQCKTSLETGTKLGIFFCVRGTAHVGRHLALWGKTCRIWWSAKIPRRIFPRGNDE